MDTINCRCRYRITELPITSLVCATGTIRENVGAIGDMPALTGIHETWTQEVVNLRDYLGNSNVRLRFGFFSNSSRNDDGFNIDNVEIVKSTHIVLSVQVYRCAGKAAVEWRTGELGCQFGEMIIDHFEVQRALDGVNYITIGTVYGGAPYKLLDAEPGTENHYRIRAVDKKQRSQYSKTVYLNYKQTTFITVTPNPASHELIIRYKCGYRHTIYAQHTGCDRQAYASAGAETSQGSRLTGSSISVAGFRSCTSLH